MKRQGSFSLYAKYIFFFLLGSLLPLAGLALGFSWLGEQTSQQFFELITKNSMVLGLSVGLSFLVVFLVGLGSALAFFSPLRDFLTNLEEGNLPAWTRRDEWGTLKEELGKIFSEQKKLREESLRWKYKVSSFSESFQKLKKSLDGNGSNNFSREDLFSPPLFANLEESLFDMREGLKKIRETLEPFSSYKKDFASHREELTLLRQEWEEVETLREVWEEGLHKLYLLFLNSSIESARMGEGGKGVEVLSQELKGLWERLGESLEDSDSSFGEMRQYFSASRETFAQIEEKVTKLEKEAREFLEKAVEVGDRGRVFLEKKLLYFSSFGAHHHQDEKKREIFNQLVQQIEKGLGPSERKEESGE